MDEARLKARMDAVDSEIGKLDLKIREYIRQIKDLELECLKNVDAGAETIKLEFLLNKQKNLYNRESKARELKVVYCQQKLELMRHETCLAATNNADMKLQIGEVHNMMSNLTTGSGVVSTNASETMKAAVNGMEC